MADPTPFDTRDMLVRAARAVGRIDAQGVRGVTSLSVQDIEAMACSLVCLGLIPIAPDAETIPDQLIIKEDQNVHV